MAATMAAQASASAYLGAQARKVDVLGARSFARQAIAPQQRLKGRRALTVRMGKEVNDGYNDPISSTISKGVQGIRELGKQVDQKSQNDPRYSEPQPPYPVQQQPFPGDESKMDPRPNYGYDSYKGSGKLKDKIAIITGGDSGIGRAVALAFAREGAHVAIAYLPEEQNDADETKQVIEEAGVQSLLIPGDLAEEETCKRIIDEVVDKFGRIDILVNNASFQGKLVDEISEISRDRFLNALKVNILAMFSMAQLALPHMKPGSSIINSASVVAYMPIPGILDYVCTKGAIVSFTKGLAQWLMSKHGIRVNAVAPGPVWTNIAVESFTEPLVAGFGGPQTPIKRAAQPRELAPAYVFLASDEASYVNAEIMNVTGGMPIN